MRGKILVEGTKEVTFDSGDIAQPVAEVSNPEIKIYPAKSKTPSPRIALIDCGAKANILRCLIARDVEVIRLPWNHDLTGIEYDGIFLSNGPGDPKACGKPSPRFEKPWPMKSPSLEFVWETKLWPWPRGRIPTNCPTVIEVKTNPV